MAGPLARYVILGLVMAAGCTHDYDQFSSPEGTGQGGNNGNGGSAGAAGSSGALGSSGVLGAAGVLGSAGVQGTGGAVGSAGALGSAGAAGTTGSAGTAGSAGTSGCGTGQKLCGTACIPNNDPATGCAAASCDACSSANSLPVCRNGACAIGSCASGFGDCANGAADGCEQDIAADVHHCGGCKNDCALQGAAGGFGCSSRACGCTSDDQCRIGATAGNVTCNTANRTCVCETTECRPGEACERQGASQRCRCNGGGGCGANQTCCRAPAGCRNLATDVMNCGACGAACAPGFVCQAGVCSCDADADCNAGSMGTCATDTGCDASPCGPRRCTCGTTPCAPGQRCFPGDRCG